MPDEIWNRLPLIIVVTALAAIGIWAKLTERHTK
jgi:hypothetical protein